MKKRIFLLLIAAIFFATVQAKAFAPQKLLSSSEQELSRHVIPLDDRYGVPSVNNVFTDNILLTIAYLSGKVTDPTKINWESIRKPFTYDLVLKPGEVFAFHDDVLAEYNGRSLVTTKAHFNAGEGFESDGYLYGDGVCHLASLLNWVGRDAGLKVTAPTNHNFAVIPDVPAQYGTAIYDNPGDTAANSRQNLYIENTMNKTAHIVFQYANDVLTVTVITK